MNERCALRLKGVHKRYGRQAVLRGLDLEVGLGETTTLLGRNGAGKSTLLRLCAAIDRADRGEVEVLGRPAERREAPIMQRIGYVPDRPDVPGWMTGSEALDIVAAHGPMLDRGWTDELVDRLRIPMRRKLRTLSRGEGMKLMLLLAVAHRPALLLLDEPFGGLDPMVREEVLSGVLETIADPHRAVLLVTHDLDVSLRLSDRLAFLEEGRIVRAAFAEEFTSTPQSSLRSLQHTWKELATEAGS